MVRIALAALAALVALAAPLAGQASLWDAQRIQVRRVELQELLTRLEEAIASPAYSAELRARAGYEAALVRERLEEGDFQPGDQIALVVQGRPELSDSMIVASGRTIALPTIGSIPLTGVLRSELEGYLRSHLGRFLKDPEVYASSTIRILVSGAVGAPGFYAVAGATPLSDVLMSAGGIDGTGELRGIRVERRQTRVWEGPILEEAITEGRTVEELNLRSGDRIVVPAGGNSLTGLTWLTSLPTLFYVLTAVARVF